MNTFVNNFSTQFAKELAVSQKDESNYFCPYGPYFSKLYVSSYVTF